MSLMENYDGQRIWWDNRSVRTGNVCFGQVVYQPGGYCGPRTQRDFELVILHSGECSVKLGNIRHELQPGSAYLLQPGRREHFRFSLMHQTHHSWCSVKPDFLPATLRRQLRLAPFSVPCTDLFDRLLASALLISDTRSNTAKQLVDQLCLSLFACFLELRERARAKTLDDQNVARALRHMEEHFADAQCLAGALHAAGCCRNLLIRKFARQTGLPPARHLWKLRTEKGIAMLAETGLTNAEIADRCGFKNPFHFSRLVKQHQGIAPREVRRRAWK